MSVRIVYQDIAAGAEEDAAVTTQDAAALSHPEILPFGTEHAPIATLEPNGWLLDGSRELLADQPIGFWSEAMSGPDGRFQAPPEVVIDFDARYTSPGISLTFDRAGGDYCSGVTIQWYQGGVKLCEGSFAPDGPEYFCARTVVAFDRVAIRLTATAAPYRYAKLSRILFGVFREFGLDELRSVRVTQEVSMISDRVAVNTLDFTLDSDSDVEYLFQAKQPASAYDGDTLIGVWYIDTSVRRQHGLYDVSCIDAIGVLDEDMFPGGIYSAYPAEALLEDILGGHFELELDAALKGAVVTGYLPACSRREALQQAAFALCAMADTSGSEAVRVYRDREATPRKIPEGRIYTGGSVDRSAVVTAVRVAAHSYSIDGPGTDTIEVGGVVYHHSVETVTIANPNTTPSDKPNVVDVSSATLVGPHNVAAVAQHLYNHYMRRDTQRVKIVMQGEKPGDHIAAGTPWGTVMNGYLRSMQIVLSGIAAAECEVVGMEVKSVGQAEVRMSGEFTAGGL